MKNSRRCSIGQFLAILLAISQCLYARSSIRVLSERAMDSIPNVIRRMQSDDPEVRYRLADELVAIERDVDFGKFYLPYELTSGDYSVILQNALKGLVHHLSDEKGCLLLYKVQHISRSHTLSGIEPVIAEFADSPSFDVSSTAVRILVDLKSPLATPYLIPALKDPDKYYGAIHDLVTVKGTDAIPHIERLLSANDSNMQHWAVWALFNLGARDCEDKIYRSFVENQQWRDINPYVLAVLTKWGDSRVYPVVMRWLTTEDDLATRDRMITRLTNVNATPIEDSVIAFLESGRVQAPDKGTEHNIKADAMRLLGMLKSNKAIPLLRKTAGDKNDVLADVAAEQLGLMEAKEAVPELLSMLDTRRDSYYWPATLALARIGEPATVERVLSELKKRRHSSHQVEVLETLAKVSAPQTYRMLRDAKLPELSSLPAEEYFAQIADKAKITLRVSYNIPQKDRDRVVAGRKGHTGLSALRRGLAMLNCAGYHCALFIEEDTVHVVPIDETYSKWDDWLAEHSLR